MAPQAPAGALHQPSSPPSATASRGCAISSPTGGYAGEKLEAALAGNGNWTLEIVRRPDKAEVFQLLPRRWVVERTFAWLGRNRRLAKDFERAIESATAWLILASVQLMIRRVAAISSKARSL